MALFFLIKNFLKNFLFYFPDGSVGKESACNGGDTGDAGLILGSGRWPGGGNGNPFQCSCLKKPMERGAWWAIVQRVAKSWTRLSTHTPTVDYKCCDSFRWIKGLCRTCACIHSPSDSLPIQAVRQSSFHSGLVTKLCPTLTIPWTAACQAPLSTGFSRQEHWSGSPLPSPGDLPDAGMEPVFPALQAVSWLQADSLLAEPPGKPLIANPSEWKLWLPRWLRW